MKLSELLENILDMDTLIKAHFNRPCFTQRLVILYEEKSILNRLMKLLLQGLMKLKKSKQ